MTNLNKQKNAIGKSNDGDAKCFFCDCTKRLKGFRNFLICETCVNAASNICEEDEK